MESRTVPPWPRRGHGWALVGMLVLPAALAACGSGSPQSATSSSGPPTTAPSAPGTTTATSAPGSVPEAGTYSDGANDVPHYIFVLSVGPGSALNGTLSFAYQDGRTATQFTFTGTAGAGTAALTSHGGGPGSMTAAWSAGSFVLDGCTTYLQYATSATACTFALTSGG